MAPMSTNEILTAQQVADELRALLAANPDAVNPTDEVGDCLYFRDEELEITHGIDASPNTADNCAIGTYALSKGWDLDTNNEGQSANGVAENNRWPVTDLAADLMGAVQAEADKHLPWGKIFDGLDLTPYL